MIRFIVNSNSGRRGVANRAVSSMETIFSATGHRYDLRFTGFRRHASKLAEEAVEEYFGLVVAVGGDGTVNEVGAALIGSEAAPGIIPTDSGNGLARELGILKLPRRNGQESHFHQCAGRSRCFPRLKRTAGTDSQLSVLTAPSQLPSSSISDPIRKHVAPFPLTNDFQLVEYTERKPDLLPERPLNFLRVADPGVKET